MGFILAAWGGPGMITKDFANHSVQLYLSRPISRTEYLFGKVSVLGSFAFLHHLDSRSATVLCQSGAPGPWLALGQPLDGRLNQSSCLIWIAIISLVSMAVAVWVKWRIAATALMLGIFFLLPAVGQILDAILRTQWGSLINFTHMISHRLGAPVPVEAQLNVMLPGFDVVPLWAAWASLLSTCAACFWLLDRKLRAREVERS